MSSRVPPIARIRLARSIPRLLALPLIVAAIGIAAAVGGALLLPGPAAIAAAAAGGLVALSAVALALVPLSVRVEVEESAVGVTWLGGARVYPLTPGPVTRVRLRGENRSSLRARTAIFGWGLGAARLRDEEAIEVVRLATTESAILIPTERGRLAIAAADENQLLEALSRAARARQRLEALADRAARTEEPAEPASAAEASPAPMTGIERAMLERRAAERAAAEAARVATPMSTEEAEPEREEAPVADTAPRRSRPPGVGLLRRPRPRVAFVLLPTLGAGIAWGIGSVSGAMPEPGTDLARLTALALVLAGPASSVGAIMALAWWPRIVGVVVAGGLASSVFIGRALIGG